MCAKEVEEYEPFQDFFGIEHGDTAFLALAASTKLFGEIFRIEEIAEQDLFEIVSENDHLPTK